MGQKTGGPPIGLERPGVEGPVERLHRFRPTKNADIYAEDPPSYKAMLVLL
ncbi:MAG: hypothetical protein ACP5I3_08735 [Thermoproteus sp.]